ncbi:MAG TPA: ATP-binding protein [Acetobacteraceae bacterium]|nr:ATP-binding protein [Acetobacteraceae bacterium]
MTAHTIIVAGDASIDWLAWPQAPDHAAPVNWRQREGTRMVARRGGSLLLADLVTAASKGPVISQSVADLHLRGPDESLHSIIDLAPVHPRSRPDPASGPAAQWRVERLRGFCGPAGCNPIQPPMTAPVDGAGLLVLDDAGNGFRDTPAAWADMLARARPRRLIVKMARPLASGPLWDAVRKGPPGDDGMPDPSRLAVVVNADDLRAEGVSLSRRLSWERTAEDFVRQLASNGRLDTLVTCADLIVRFDTQGVMHHRGLSGEQPTLYFYPDEIEGDDLAALPGAMVGMTAAFTAGLVTTLASGSSDDIGTAIRCGMTAARHLARTGFVPDVDGVPDYPRRAVHDAEAGDTRIAAVPVPSDWIIAHNRWLILEDTMGDPADAARRLVTHGPEVALGQTPVARINKVVTADRQEIEAFRATGNALHEYLTRPRSRPLSIGVFGPPGTGKSFTVKQVAEAEAARSGNAGKLEFLEFNLSQFAAIADLNIAFHLVRDSALSGSVPIVFFDEFDSPFQTDHGWLRFFLTPMQDGMFLENGRPHPIGRAVFIFAGGIHPSFAHFSAPLSAASDDAQRLAFNAAKGPDFISRLRVKVDVLGPDPQGPDDVTFPIRRGFLLRSMLLLEPGLTRREPGLTRPEPREERIDIHAGVLNAFLNVPHYNYGVRSMQAIVEMSTLSGARTFSPAALPPASQLSLHVPADEFLQLVQGERMPDDLREKLGRVLHSAYRTARLALADDDAERERLSSDAAQQNWDVLREDLKESNRLQADDIPRKLRAVNCYIAAPREDVLPVAQFADDEVEQLAEMEHERYNAERLRAQWRLGRRDVARRSNPFLVPWRDLADKWRELDRSAVKAIIPALASVDLVVRRMR